MPVWDLRRLYFRRRVLGAIRPPPMPVGRKKPTWKMSFLPTSSEKRVQGEGVGLRFRPIIDDLKTKSIDAWTYLLIASKLRAVDRFDDDLKTLYRISDRSPRLRQRLRPGPLLLPLTPTLIIGTKARRTRIWTRSTTAAPTTKRVYDTFSTRWCVWPATWCNWRRPRTSRRRRKPCESCYRSSSTLRPRGSSTSPSRRSNAFWDRRKATPLPSGCITASFPNAIKSRRRSKRRSRPRRPTPWPHQPAPQRRRIRRRRNGAESRRRSTIRRRGRCRLRLLWMNESCTKSSSF